MALVNWYPQAPDVVVSKDFSAGNYSEEKPRQTNAKPTNSVNSTDVYKLM